MPHMLFQILQASCIHSNRTDCAVGKNKAKTVLTVIYTQFCQALSVFTGRKLILDIDIAMSISVVSRKLEIEE